MSTGNYQDSPIAIPHPGTKPWNQNPQPVSGKWRRPALATCPLTLVAGDVSAQSLTTLLTLLTLLCTRSGLTAARSAGSTPLSRLGSPVCLAIGVDVVVSSVFLAPDPAPLSLSLGWLASRGRRRLLSGSGLLVFGEPFVSVILLGIFLEKGVDSLIEICQCQGLVQTKS